LLGLGRRKKREEAEAAVRSRIVADLRGATVAGQVAVGEHIVQIHAEKGAVVNYAGARERAAPKLRHLPVQLLPRDFARPVGRGRELREATDALAGGGPAELHGPDGAGKTALLRHLAHRPPAGAPDGVVYQLSRAQPLADVLQFVFEALYECPEPTVATPAELRLLLRDRHALLVVDDLDLERDGLQALLDAAPSCAFLTASRDRRLFGDGSSVALRPLDDDDVVALVERELGRPLAGEERAAALGAVRQMGGTPLAALQAAAIARGEA
jgi:AAA domain-containing protein